MSKDLGQLSSTGMLWFLNRTVFLPRGYEMVLTERKGVVTGWDIISSDTSFGDDPEMVHKVEALFADLARTVAKS